MKRIFLNGLWVCPECEATPGHIEGCSVGRKTALADEAERDRLRGALERIATDTDDLGYETAAAEAARSALKENT